MLCSLILFSQVLCLSLCASYNSIQPGFWFSNSKFSRNSNSIIDGSLSNKNNKIFDFNFENAFPAAPKLSLAIQRYFGRICFYIGSDDMTEQNFQMTVFSLTAEKFKVRVKTYPNTVITKLSVVYLAVAQHFPYHFNTLNNVAFNLTQNQTDARTNQADGHSYTNIINYTQQFSAFKYNTFQQPLNCNKIIIYVTSFSIKSTKESLIGIEIVSNVTTKNTYELKLTVKPFVKIFSYVFQLISFDVNNLYSAGIKVHYSGLEYSKNEPIISLQASFIDSFIIGFADFQVTLGQCQLKAEWQTEKLEETYRINILSLMFQNGSCRMLRSKLFLFSVERQWCKSSHPYYNQTGKLCQDGCDSYTYPGENGVCADCSHGCKLCSNNTDCLQCNFDDHRQIENGSCICIDGYYDDLVSWVCQTCNTVFTNCSKCSFDGSEHRCEQCNSKDYLGNDNCLKYNNSQERKPQNQDFKEQKLNISKLFEEISAEMKNSAYIVDGINSIPMIRILLKFLSPLFFCLDEYWFYIYHDVNYSNFTGIQTFLVLITKIQSQKMVIVPIRDTIEEIEQMVNFNMLFSSDYSNYTSSKYQLVEHSDQYLMRSFKDMILWNYSATLLLVLLFYISHRILSFAKVRNRLLVSIKQFLFESTTIYSITQGLIETNLIYIVFESSMSLTTFFSFNFADKLNNLLAVLFLFTTIWFSCTFYIMLFRFFYYSRSPQFFEKNQKVRYSHFYFKCIIYCSFFNLFNFVFAGFAHSLLMPFPEVQILTLASVKLLVLLINFIFVKHFQSIILFFFTILYYLAGIGIDILIYFKMGNIQKNETIVLQAILIWTMIFSMIFKIVVQIVLMLKSVIHQFYFKQKQNQLYKFNNFGFNLHKKVKATKQQSKQKQQIHFKHPQKLQTIEITSKSKRQISPNEKWGTEHFVKCIVNKKRTNISNKQKIKQKKENQNIQIIYQKRTDTETSFL